MMRTKIQPILEAIPASRQEDARHYGVHPYFTRRPANVVRAYVERYSHVGDTVLDPFGGTGVTAIEAFLLGRRAIQNDLNPFANFIAKNIADTTMSSTLKLREAFGEVEDACLGPISEIEKNNVNAMKWLAKVELPKNIRLPSNSDADNFFDMFTPKQLAGLAVIKQAIDQQPKGILSDLLRLAWSASVAKLNKTFLSAKGRAASRGGSSIFSIYRYKIASEYIELPIWDTFRGRFRNVLAAKEEVLQCRTFVEQQSHGKRTLDSEKSFFVHSQDASELDRIIKPGSVDYIFTDPPYGAFISYLDLSILWNHWLGFSISDEDRKKETIVGGELEHTEEHYKQSLGASIKACVRLLRPDRWFSVVFQHWDSSYFATILESAAEAGAELQAAITQTGDVIWSMHKKKNSANVLAGELILTFYKPRSKTKGRVESEKPSHHSPDILSEVFDACLQNGTSQFTSEALFNRIVIELWNRRALSCLSVDRQEFAKQLEDRGWKYDAKKHMWGRSKVSRETERVTLFE
jgi:DNA modification methylase